MYVVQEFDGCSHKSRKHGEREVKKGEKAQ
jgi:hypothetical protein